MSCRFISTRSLHYITLLFTAWCLVQSDSFTGTVQVSCLVRKITLLLPHNLFTSCPSLGTCEDMGPITHAGLYSKINVPRTKQSIEHDLLSPSPRKKGMLCYSRRNRYLLLLSLVGVRNVVILIVTPHGRWILFFF